MPKSRQGVSLIELLVVMGLVSLIFTVLIALVSQSSSLVSHGAQVISLNQKARFAVDKIAPYLATAVNDNGSAALNSPSGMVSAPTAADLQSYTTIQFTTTEDFLDPAYDPRAPYDYINRPVYYYEIYFDNTTDPIPYTLEDGSNINLGRIMIRRYTDPTFGTIDPAVQPQAIAYNVQFFYTHLLSGGVVEVMVHTVGKRKGPAGNQIDVFEQAQGILDIPAPEFYY